MSVRTRKDHEQGAHTPGAARHAAFKGMHEPGAFGQFLKLHPEYRFDVVEHLYAAEVIDEAWARVENLVRSVREPSPGSPWRERREAIRSVVSPVAAYASIDWSREDYETTIRPVAKDELRDSLELFLQPGADNPRTWLRPTSGTSGPPLGVRYDVVTFAEFQYFGAAAALAYTGLLGAAIDGRPVFAIAVVDNSYLEHRIWVDPSCRTGVTLRPVFDTAEPRAGRKLLSLVAEYRPAVLTLKPSDLRILVEEPGSALERAGEHLVAVVSGGAPLPEALRDEVSKRMRTPVVNSYGMSEIGRIASSCPMGWLHVHERNVILEVLADGGTAARVGEGELLPSTIGNRAMPLLRYRSGDFGRVVDEPCPCGLAGRRIIELLGRAVPSFKVARGGYFTPTNLNPLIGQFALREFQATQVETGHVHLRVEFSEEEQVGRLPELKSAAQKIVGELFEISVEATVFRREEKFQRYRTLV